MTNVDLKTLIRNLFGGIEHTNRMTHSGIVIALAAILDNQLERALKHAVRPLFNNMYERVFGSFRPLSSFSSKIVMAYAVGIIPLELYQELEKIRNIRVRDKIVPGKERCLVTMTPSPVMAVAGPTNSEGICDWLAIKPNR